MACQVADSWQHRLGQCGHQMADYWHDVMHRQRRQHVGHGRQREFRQWRHHVVHQGGHGRGRLRQRGRDLVHDLPGRSRHGPGQRSGRRP